MKRALGRTIARIESEAVMRYTKALTQADRPLADLCRDGRGLSLGGARQG